jgi:hypothetical protein
MSSSTPPTSPNSSNSLNNLRTQLSDMRKVVHALTNTLKNMNIKLDSLIQLDSLEKDDIPTSPTTKK